MPDLDLSRFQLRIHFIAKSSPRIGIRTLDGDSRRVLDFGFTVRSEVELTITAEYSNRNQYIKTLIDRIELGLLLDLIWILIVDSKSDLLLDVSPFSKPKPGPKLGLAFFMPINHFAQVLKTPYDNRCTPTNPNLSGTLESTSCTT